jgi:hypothetical protein
VASFGSLIVLGALTLAAALVALNAAPPATHPAVALDRGHLVPTPMTAATTPNSDPTTTTTRTPTSTSAVPTTTTLPPTTAATAPPTTTTAAPPPAPATVSRTVTAVGDSVMIDYQGDLQADIPGVVVDASVSRQWSEGESILQSLKADGQLGSDVIVALSTNGPITDADFDNMMAILSGVTRVVFVNVHVDQPWQDPNNAVIASGVARYPNAVLADWASLAAQNPQWFGPDGTHLAIGGPGAQALAALITATLTNG